MLHFSLDRPLPSSGEVLPILSLPAKLQLHSRVASIETAEQSVVHSTLFCDREGSSSSSGIDRSGAYEKVVQLCRGVHATCVRQIPLTHTAPNSTEASAHANLTSTSNTSSTPISAHQPHASAEHTVTSTPHSTVPTTQGFSAYALESPGYLGIAGKVWDSMYVLLQYLALHQAEFVRGKRIVELGCGTGLAGETTQKANIYDGINRLFTSYAHLFFSDNQY